jgi:Winged helix DNA-binding domain
MAADILSARELNRATLDRQYLLDRASLAVEPVLEHLVGMQGQNPLDPYYGLWARLEHFQPGELARMTNERQVVRGQFMRGTIHLFTAEDALRVHPLTRAVLERVFRSTSFSKDVAAVDLERLLREGRALLDRRPRTRAELAEELSGRFPGVEPGSLAQAVTYLIPVVQVPPRGVWGAKGPAAWAPIDAFLGRAYGVGISLDDLVVRYLAAFGPASVKDMRAWSGLTGLSEVFDRLRRRLRCYRSEEGSELFDLPDLQLPDPGTPAPPRLLPEYDNLLLGHSDRSRFFLGDAKPQGWVGNALVDGVFAGSWKVDRDCLQLRLTEHGMTEEDAVIDEATRLTAQARPDELSEIRVTPF